MIPPKSRDTPPLGSASRLRRYGGRRLAGEGEKRCRFRRGRRRAGGQASFSGGLFGRARGRACSARRHRGASSVWVCPHGPTHGGRPLFRFRPKQRCEWKNFQDVLGGSDENSRRGVVVVRAGESSKERLHASFGRRLRHFQGTDRQGKVMRKARLRFAAVESQCAFMSRLRTECSRRVVLPQVRTAFSQRAFCFCLPGALSAP